MNSYQGIIWVHKTKTADEKVELIVYLVTEDFNHYQLIYQPYLNVENEYLYPYHLRPVYLYGKINDQNYLEVDSIHSFYETDDIFVFKPKYIFSRTDFPDIISVEGPILSIVEQVFKDDDDMENSRLWLKARLKTGDKYLYTKVNETALKLFFLGRLKIRELFMLRNDEVYILEEIKAHNRSQKQLFYSDKFENDYLEKLEYAYNNFFDLESGPRLGEDIYKTLKLYKIVNKKLELYWTNSFAIQPNH